MKRFSVSRDCGSFYLIRNGFIDYVLVNERALLVGRAYIYCQEVNALYINKTLLINALVSRDCLRTSSQDRILQPNPSYPSPYVCVYKLLTFHLTETYARSTYGMKALSGYRCYLLFSYQEDRIHQPSN